MNETRHHHGHDGHSPYWKRAHHDWRFWVGMCLMFAAISMYVMSDDLSWLPRGRPRQPLPGSVAK